MKYKLVHDQLGSVRLVVNSNTGEIVSKINYDEFGRPTERLRPGFQSIGYAGGIRVGINGLYRFGARDYDPSIGRWTSKDPILFNGGDTNLYGYVLQDPINFIDPEGKWATIAVGAGAGAIAGGLTSNCGWSDPGLWQDVLVGGISGAAAGTGVGLIGGSVGAWLGVASSTATSIGGLGFNLGAGALSLYGGGTCRPPRPPQSPPTSQTQPPSNPSDGGQCK